MKIHFLIFAFKIKFCSKIYFLYTLKLSIKYLKGKNSKFLGKIFGKNFVHMPALCGCEMIISNTKLLKPSLTKLGFL